jgi:hypothetical protein
MASTRRPVYREWSPWAAWIQVVFWGAMLFSMVSVATGPSRDPATRWMNVLLLGVVLVLTQWLVAGLSVRLYQDDMKVSLGVAGLIGKRIRYEDIEALESVTYHPLMEFGGWGVRFRGKKRAWTARGNTAVVLHLADGVLLYVGSDKPHRLEERIRAVAGTRMGKRRSA